MTLCRQRLHIFKKYELTRLALTYKTASHPQILRAKPDSSHLEVGPAGADEDHDGEKQHAADEGEEVEGDGPAFRMPRRPDQVVHARLRQSGDHSQGGCHTHKGGGGGSDATSASTVEPAADASGCPSAHPQRRVPSGLSTGRQRWSSGRKAANADVLQHLRVVYNDLLGQRTWLSRVRDLKVTSTIMAWWMRCAVGPALTTSTLHSTVATTNRMNITCHASRKRACVACVSSKVRLTQAARPHVVAAPQTHGVHSLQLLCCWHLWVWPSTQSRCAPAITAAPARTRAA